MRLTLAEAVERLSDHAPAGRVEDRLNRAHERLMLSGKFTGTVRQVVLKARYGVVTLPRWCSALLAARANDNVRPIANQWFSFLPGKVGVYGSYSQVFEDLGDGWATLVNVPAGGTLESDEDMLVTGTDSDGLPIELSLTANTPTANPFSDIKRVHKVRGDAPASLVHTSEDNDEVTLALMEPGEEDAYYHRYYFSGLKDEAESTVTALCKMRHIDAQAEADTLLITNLSALGLAMDSLQAEAELDYERAEYSFNKALQILNSELAESRSPDQLGKPRISLSNAGSSPVRAMY